jgi:hypothetical protein
MKQLKKILSVAFAVIFVIAAAQIASAPANAAMIKASAVCKKGTSYCMRFFSTDAILVVTSMAFVAPTNGTALVSFDGSMQCVNGSTDNGTGFGVVDLTTQIVNDNTPPDAQEPGGARIALRLPPAAGATFAAYSAAINLASSRVVALKKGGPHKFHFKIAQNRMDTLTTCTVFNGTFNVVFVP